MKAFCINLKHRTDRKEAMEEQFDKVTCLDWDFVEAIYGNEERCCPPGFSTFNEYACLLSHLKALQLAREYDMALILEDDIEFVDNFDSKFEDLLNNIPKEWDIIYLTIYPNELEKLPLIEGFYVAIGQYGAMAYLVNKESTKKIIKEVEHKLFIYDQHLALIQNDRKCFIAKPLLCTLVDHTYSDLQRNVVVYPELKNYI